MIRIEYKPNGTYVETKWVKEGDGYVANIGRLILTQKEFQEMQDILQDNKVFLVNFIEKENDSRK